MKPLLIILLLFVGLFAKSQQKFDDKTRAIFIFDIIKYITWANEAAIDTFCVGVLDNKNSLEEELKKVAAIRLQVHKKPIKVIRFQSIESIDNCNTVFVNNESGFDIDKILKKISGKPIL
ncbi:MAG: hypothetical protein COZ59_11450, partial [Bacteroidetes bacterium CG_4_8_14_3_um_filter_31_14]